MNLKAPKISSPFSSKTDEDKEILNERLNLYKDKLDDQWSDVKADFAAHGKRAAIIGGVVLGVYGLFNLVVRDVKEEKAEEKEEAKVNKAGISMSGAIQSLLWAAAMGWAKQKFVDFVVADNSEDNE